MLSLGPHPIRITNVSTAMADHRAKKRASSQRSPTGQYSGLPDFLDAITATEVARSRKITKWAIHANAIISEDVLVIGFLPLVRYKLSKINVRRPL